MRVVSAKTLRLCLIVPVRHLAEQPFKRMAMILPPRRDTD